MFAGNEIHTRLKLPSQDSVLNLIRQLDHRVDLLAALFASPEQLFKLFVHSVVATKEGIDLVLLNRETSLDGLFTGPVFSVRLSLDEDLNPHCT